MGLTVSSSNPSMERPSGRMELASKRRNRSLSMPGPFVNGFAAKNDDHAGETGQRDRDLRGNTKSFARFH